MAGAGTEAAPVSGYAALGRRAIAHRWPPAGLEAQGPSFSLRDVAPVLGPLCAPREANRPVRRVWRAANCRPSGDLATIVRNVRRATIFGCVPSGRRLTVRQFGGLGGADLCSGTRVPKNCPPSFQPYFSGRRIRGGATCGPESLPGAVRSRVFQKPARCACVRPRDRSLWCCG